MAPQPAQVWVVIARRSSIIGWACHQDMRQDRLQNLCPRRGWSIACPQSSHTVVAPTGRGETPCLRHHDFTVSRPTPVSCAICPKVAPLIRRRLIRCSTCGSTVTSPSFHQYVLGRHVNRTQRDAFTGSGCCHALGGGRLVVITPRNEKSAPTHRCWWAGAQCQKRLEIRRACG